MRCLATAVLSIAVIFSAAQEKVFHIKPGEKISDVLTNKDIYLYPSFQIAQVFFRSDKTAGGLMNLSFITGEFHFIDNNGDTLALDNEHTLKMVHSGKDTFYYQDGILKMIDGNSQWKLAKKQEIRMVQQQQAGAFDQGMPSSALSYTSIRIGNQQMDNLIVRESITLVLHTEYFIGDKFNRFTMLNKKKPDEAVWQTGKKS